MVLHRSNFEVPAQLNFLPYAVEWRFVRAETVDWVEGPKLLGISSKEPKDSDKTWLRVRIEIPKPSTNLYNFDFPGIGAHPMYTVLMNRASIPTDVLPAHENCHNAPDVSDRWFQTLVCQIPELKSGLWNLKPGEVTKNAWIMRDEFVNLEANPDPVLGWDWSVRGFLNKWGIWEYDRGYSEDWAARPPLLMMPPSVSLSESIYKSPDFLLVMPHLLKAQQEMFRKALLPSNSRPWLGSHPLGLETADKFPFFRVRRSDCHHAIEATITIDHLEKRQFGICKRCRKVFQRKTRHKKNYCSERCFNAAGVQRWRLKQRLKAKRGGKR